MDETTSYEDLEEIRRATMEEIILLDQGSDVSKVGTEVKAAGLQARFWRAVSLLAAYEGDIKTAANAAIQSCKFSEQQTRASKSLVADRLDELEKQYADSIAAATGLRLVQ